MDVGYQTRFGQSFHGTFRTLRTDRFCPLAYSKVKYEFSDLQILSVEMPQELLDEAQPEEGQVDQGVQGDPRQGFDERHHLRARTQAQQA